MLAWLKTLAEPEKEEVMMLTESTMDSMSQLLHHYLVFPGVATAGRVRVPSGTGAGGPWDDLSYLVHLLTELTGRVLATDRAGDGKGARHVDD